VFFIPGSVYIADAVGTQTEVLVVRGLSLGVMIEDVVRRELATSVALGAIRWRWPPPSSGSSLRSP